MQQSCVQRSAEPGELFIGNLTTPNLTSFAAAQFLIVKLTYVGIGKHFGGQNPDGERKVEAWEPHR